jgi:regulator of protease activity HflC (stomatin/prohibitin superfamily)
MGWLIFQGLVFLAVYWSNLEWRWVPNDNYLVVGIFGVGAALVATLAVSWIIGTAKALAARRSQHRGRTTADQEGDQSPFSEGR